MFYLQHRPISVYITVKCEPQIHITYVKRKKHINKNTFGQEIDIKNVKNKQTNSKLSDS